ncbi:thioredoxin family protein [Streptococcus uberis]|uniref:thioredoxin family protein n=1 Tax=Streptococcus uberis TaxID=1349 RepID=UPI001FF53E3D|nr:thioredoxin family protein [Streptococcus uberis]MCK1226169.1 thioredoxin family protein [Streptococcus uberis]
MKYPKLIVNCFIVIMSFCFGFWSCLWNIGHDVKSGENEYYNTKIDENVNLVFYKEDCPYCKAGKSEVNNQAIKSNVVTYFIDAETKEGITIARKYHVEYAPTMVVIRNNDYRSFLYAHVKGKKIVVEKNKIKEAFRK